MKYSGRVQSGQTDFRPMCRRDRTCKIYQVLFVFRESSHIYHEPYSCNPSSSVIRLREKLLLLSFPHSPLPVHLGHTFLSRFRSLAPARRFAAERTWCYLLLFLPSPCNDSLRRIPRKTRDLLFLRSPRDYISFHLGCRAPNSPRAARRAACVDRSRAVFVVWLLCGLLHTRTVLHRAIRA